MSIHNSLYLPESSYHNPGAGIIYFHNYFFGYTSMKKILSSPISCLLLTILFLFCIFCLKNGGEDPHFVEISNELLQENYENDTLSTSFSFQNPKEFGLTTENVSLPLYDKEDYLSSGASVTDAIARLEEINPDHLSEITRTTYDVLLPYMKKQLDGTKFPYYEEPLSPTGGIHISLPVLLAEFPVEDEEDLKCYLSVLSLVPAYFDSLADFEADKAAAGMFMASEDVDLVVSQCDFFASESGKKFFRDCFELTLKKICSEDETLFASYTKKHDAVLEEKVLPAYRKLGDSMLLLKEDGKARAGLCRYENGRKYYEYLLQKRIGTDASTAEIEKKLCTRLEELYCELSLLQAKLPGGTVTDELTLAAKTAPADAPSCLSSIQEKMKDVFPAFSSGSHVTIKEIPSSLADYTAPAYYFTPNICVSRPGNVSEIQNIIYVGKEIKKDPVQLFTTLAHEGYPGHMYQNIYFLSSQGVSRKNVLRYCMNFPGYSEGWAMYVEILSYTYAEGNETYLELLRLSREIQLCLLCILDIRVHDSGASIMNIAPYLGRLGIKDPADIENVFSYLVNEPGTYLQYYGGYLELLECKELYRKKCITEGITYSDLDFHTFFLEHGPDSYVNIKRCITAGK